MSYPGHEWCAIPNHPRLTPGTAMTKAECEWLAQWLSWEAPNRAAIRADHEGRACVIAVPTDLRELLLEDHVRSIFP